LGLAESFMDSPAADLEGMKIFHAGGGQGDPPTTPIHTTTLARSFIMMANLIQTAGPNLNPQNMAARAPLMGKVGGGTTNKPLLAFGSGNYQWVQDVRLLYWNQNRKSPYNGKDGMFMTVGGTRYSEGTFANMPSGPDVPIPAERH
jgi:hypothetical protein